jgi:sulfite oxidase
MKLSRRDFILASSAVVTACSYSPVMAEIADSQAANEMESCGLLSRWLSPPALEMPRAAASSWLTPTECFYVFNHSDFPALTIQEWQLKISGEVEHPLTLSWAKINRIKQVEVVNTLECAGNGRAFFRPRIPGVKWATGAIGNAIFRGPRLRDLLVLAKVKKTARHAGFVGADNISATDPQFVRSIPLDKAHDRDTILAITMNGKPLTPDHGYPLRALVPGWVGAASVKRITEIQLLANEAQGEMMQTLYRIPDPEHPSKPVAVTALKIKSIITRPLDGSILPRAPLVVQGVAWAGESTVAKVELSTDSGKSWRPAEIAVSQGKYSWRSWQYLWTPANAGTFSIAVRATDASGNVQPQTPPWNPRGYLWNGIDSIRIVVRS